MTKFTPCHSIATPNCILFTNPYDTVTNHQHPHRNITPLNKKPPLRPAKLRQGKSTVYRIVGTLNINILLRPPMMRNSQPIIHRKIVTANGYPQKPQQSCDNIKPLRPYVEGKS